MEDCRSKVIGELRRGSELAKQLQILMMNKSSSSAENSAEDLLEGILNSFHNAISVIASNGDQMLANEFSQSPPRKMCGRMSEDSDEGSKSSIITTTSGTKDKRGCYKRSRKSDNTWTKESSSLVDDGYAWRKYGQKAILNCNHSRNYFRCTYKSNGCKAKKQVQQTRDIPPLYLTTYHNNHTCQDLLKPTQVVLDGDDFTTKDSKMLLKFANDHQKPCKELAYNESPLTDFCLSSHNNYTPFGSDYDQMDVTATHHSFDMKSLMSMNVDQFDDDDDDVLQQYYEYQ